MINNHEMFAADETLKHKSKLLAIESPLKFPYNGDYPSCCLYASSPEFSSYSLGLPFLLLHLLFFVFEHYKKGLPTQYLYFTNYSYILS